MNATGQGYGRSASCDWCVAAPKQPSAASVVIVVGSDESKWWRITVLGRVDESPFKASGHAGDHRKGASFYNNSVRGFAIRANPSI